MDVDEIRGWAEENERYGYHEDAEIKLAIADLRDAYHLVVNAWSHLPNQPLNKAHRDRRLSLEVTMARIARDISRIVREADLPEEMSL